TGSEWTRTGETFTFRLFPNRFVYSREQNRSSAPYFTIELGPDDRQPPGVPSDLEGRSSIQPRAGALEGSPRVPGDPPPPQDRPAGEALVSWITPRAAGPAGTLGFLVTLDDRELPRELIPMAGAPGDRVEMHLRDVKVSPGATVKLSVRAVDGA